jgi:NAD(P) transhydrogenase
MNYDYDLIVIGTGPSGQRAAITASEFGKRVAIIDRREVVGGVCINTGTIPSKTIREAVIKLTGVTERVFYGASYRVKEKITAEDLLARVNKVVKREINIAKTFLRQNNVEVLYGVAGFIDDHTIEYTSSKGAKKITGDKILIAVGTTPFHLPELAQIDNELILDSDSIVKLKCLPKSLIVVGGGVIGIEYASIFATLGIEVTVVDRNDKLLPFVDREIIDSLVHQMRENGASFRLNEKVAKVEINQSNLTPITVTLKSAKVLKSDMVLFSLGRRGATDELNLEAAGLKADSKGLLKVNDHYQTEVPNIYASGDVIGFPALASTSMEQGRQAAYRAFDLPWTKLPGFFPYGLYSVPEISYVGATEDELSEQAIPYEVGIARYRETARGQILGDFTGVLKLLVHRETEKLLGVHAIGTGATELIHIGQAVIALEGTVGYLVDSVFNYPTLAECYKIAALNVYNKLHR